MAFGELPVNCPFCQHRTTLPIAAIKRDNFYCPKCLQKVPLSGVRTTSDDDSRSQPARKKSSRTGRR
jgi:hypothetical protein